MLQKQTHFTLHKTNAKAHTTLQVRVTLSELFKAVAVSCFPSLRRRRSKTATTLRTIAFPVTVTGFLQGRSGRTFFS